MRFDLRVWPFSRPLRFATNAKSNTTCTSNRTAWIEGGQLFFDRTDHIRCPAADFAPQNLPRGGRPVFATNDLGLKVWEASYLPFGGVHTSTVGIDLRFPPSRVSSMHCRATGQWFQSESGLHQNWMRDHDPTLGRYLQGDPLGLVPGPSLYGYACQNPFGYYDPNGEHPLVVAALSAGTASLALDFAVEMLFGDGCYTMQNGVTTFALGAATGGGGFADKGKKRVAKSFHILFLQERLKNPLWVERSINALTGIEH